MKKLSLFKQKLFNKNGVSILFALLLFLVVSMVSVTIIAAATSTSKQLNSIKDTNQANVDLDSAVLFLKKNLNGVNYYRDYDNSKSKKFNNFGKDAMNNSNIGSNVFYNEIDTVARKFLNDENSYLDSYSNTFVLSSSIDEMNDINISYKYKVNSSHNNSYIIFKLETNNDNNENVLYIKFNLSYKTETVEKSQSGNYKKKFTRYTATFKFEEVYSYDPS